MESLEGIMEAQQFENQIHACAAPQGSKLADF